MDNNLITIVTPAYNRGELLMNCFRSLQNQTDKHFEWIIVDDGSTDDTEQIVRQFEEELPDFPIVYVWKENGGKHTALNASHEFIRGRYVLMLDSDDTLVPSAVEQVLNAWTRYEADEEIGLVTFLKGESEEKPTCMAPDEGVPVDIMRYRRKCFYSADCCEVIRTELFLKYPFPVFEGEKFLSEGVLWNRVSLTHKCVYVNRVIYLCEYLDDGLTRSGRGMRIRNPRGGMLSSSLNMHSKNYFSRRVKNGLLFACYGFFAGESPIEMLRHSDYKLLTACCMPGGWVLFRYWGKKYGNK